MFCVKLNMKSIKINFAVSVLLVSGLLLFSNVNFAQEMAGVVSDNMAGSNRGIINPAALFDSPNCLDISIASANFSIQNNYFYMPRGTFSFRDLAYFDNTYLLEPGNYFSVRTGKKSMNVRQNLRLQGPSVLFRYGNHSFALVSAARGVSSVKRVPDHVLNFLTEGLSFAPQHNVEFNESRPFSIASAGWTELGLSYATRLNKALAESIVAGIAAKYLWGYHGLSVRSDDLEYMVNDARHVNFSRFNATGLASLPIDYMSNEFTGYQNRAIGRGFSFDVGISYTLNDEGVLPGRRDLTNFKTPYVTYKYRLGFSLLDIGAMRIKENTRRVEFDNLNLAWPNPDWSNYSNLDAFVLDLRQNISSGEIISIQGQDFWLYLPMAASIQFDYHLGKNFFGYIFMVKDLPIFRNRVARSSQLGIVPRYETRWFALALPVTLHEYRKPRLGLSVRLAFLTIGTEQPGGMFNINDADGLDFYFSLTWGLKNCQFRKRSANPCLNAW